MPLPTAGSVPLVPLALGAGVPLNPAYLVKFPEEVWASLQDAAADGAGLSISVEGGMSINIPHHPPIPLEAHSTGNPSELHLLSSSSSTPTRTPTLSLVSLASARLSVPHNSASSARAADRLKAQNEAFDRERKERAERVNLAEDNGRGKAKSSNRQVAGLAAAGGAGMARGLSSPQMAITAHAPAERTSTTITQGQGGGGGGGGGGGQPMIPLKTRVMQLLALGATTVADIVRRVGGDEENVMRVVKVVGRVSSTHPLTYTLLPNQYSKLKLGPGQWKYTYVEQQQVIRLAREAFDELDLPSDAEERADLDRKEQEANNGYLSGGSGSGSGSSSKSAIASAPAPAPQQTASPKLAPSRTASPSTTSRAKVNGNGHSTNTNTNTSSSNGSSSAGKAAKAAPQSKIARERARFMAEKRAVSLPNVKSMDGTASPRLTPAPGPAPVTSSLSRSESTKRKRETEPQNKDKDKEMEEPKKRRRGRESFDYSSDSSDSNSNRLQLATRGSTKLTPRSRSKGLAKAGDGDGKEAKAPLVTVSKFGSVSPSKRKMAVEFSPSDEDGEGEAEAEAEEGEIRGRARSRETKKHAPAPGSPTPPTKRKPPPPELRLNGNGSGSGGTSGNVHPLSAPIPKYRTSTPAPAPTPKMDEMEIAPPAISDDRNPNGPNGVGVGVGVGDDPRPDPEALRDRYEELFPAYQQLAVKLAKIHRQAELGSPDAPKGRGEEGGERIQLSPGPEEIRRMVAKWERWHNELAEIRRWFGA